MKRNPIPHEAAMPQVGPVTGWDTQVLSKRSPNLNDPELALELACRTERNDLIAANLGLPRVGAFITNCHGLDFTVRSHSFLPTAQTVGRWNEGDRCHAEDLFPVIEPTNLSKKLLDFILAVDRCTSRILILVDTVPGIRHSALPGHNCIDSSVMPDSMVVYLDAARVHETVLAHEIGHAWVQYVEQCEDERVLADQSNTERLNQFNFIQSFVLDLKVNNVLRRKGFDMQPLDADLAASMNALGHALGIGYRPENRREGVFMALQVAAQIVERQRGNASGLVRFDDTLTAIEKADTELYELASGFADAVTDSGLESKEAIRSAIDKCLTLGFGYSLDPPDLEQDLLLPQQTEPEFDKHPEWLPEVTLGAKHEVGRLMALNDIPDGSRITLDFDQESVTFVLEDDKVIGPWKIPGAFPRNHFSPEQVRKMNDASRARQDQLRQNPMNPSNPQQFFPGGIPGRRAYMSGLGRFLTQARLEEQLLGEHPYGYAFNNPTTYIDPSGLLPDDAARFMKPLPNPCTNCTPNPIRPRRGWVYFDCSCKGLMIWIKPDLEEPGHGGTKCNEWIDWSIPQKLDRS